MAKFRALEVVWQGSSEPVTDDAQRERFLDWVRTQGVDPTTVVVGSRIVRMPDGRLEWIYQEFLTNADGKRIICGAIPYRSRLWGRVTRRGGHYAKRQMTKFVASVPEAQVCER